MSDDCLKVVFFGSSEFVVPILASLKESQNQTLEVLLTKNLNYLLENCLSYKPKNLDQQDFLETIPDSFLQKKVSLSLVVSQPDRQNRKKIISNPISVFARENKIALFTPERINKSILEFQERVGEFDFGLTASFGQIISQKVLDLAKYGFLNWHPSLLPKYRGPTPMQTAICQGEQKSGLSWIEMTKKMDAGNILLQVDYDLDPATNIQKLASKMSEFGVNTWAIAMANRFLLALGKTKFCFPQDEQEITFCQMLSKEDRLVKPFKQTSKDIFNHFRAYQWYPKTSFVNNYFEGEIRILNCQISLLPDSYDLLYEDLEWLQIKSKKQLLTFLKCAKETFLQINQIQDQKGKKIDFKGWVFTDKNKLND